MVKANLIQNKNRYIRANYLILLRAFNLLSIFCLVIGLAISLVFAFYYKFMPILYLFLGVLGLLIFIFTFSYILFYLAFKRQAYKNVTNINLMFNDKAVNIKYFENENLIDEATVDFINFYKVIYVFGAVLILLDYTNYLLIEKGDVTEGNLNLLSKILKQNKSAKH